MKNTLTAVLLFCFAATAFAGPDSLKFEGEKRLKNIKMLTDIGENAEAYLSFSGDKLIYQRTAEELECDQIFIMNLDGTNSHMVSNGEGRTTCAYFLPGDNKIIYASTYLEGDKCPPPPDRSKGYVWKLYESFDLFIRD